MQAVSRRRFAADIGILERLCSMELAYVKTTERDRLLRRGIGERRLLRFTLTGCDRIAEPHDYGVQRGRLRLFFYQVDGASSSGQPLGWRLVDVDKLSRLELLEARFAGPRATSSGRHVVWDELHASVSRNPDRHRVVD